MGLGPSHDWSSHAADAFGLMALSMKTLHALPASSTNRFSEGWFRVMTFTPEKDVKNHSALSRFMMMVRPTVCGAGVYVGAGARSCGHCPTCCGRLAARRIFEGRMVGVPQPPYEREFHAERKIWRLIHVHREG